MSSNQSLRQAVLNRYFARMNDRQREAVYCVNGPLLILAGAGSGKTTVLIHRIANLIRFGSASESDAPLSAADEALLRPYADGSAAADDAVLRAAAVHPVRPWNILAITFTNKAAGELKDRLAQMLGPDDASGVWASTFHAACARMLRRDGDRLGYSSHFTVYDTDDSKRVMRDCIKSLHIDEKELPVRSVLNEISRAKDQLISPDEFRASAGQDVRLQRIGEAYKLYQRQLKAADAMDFDDLLVNGVRLLRENEDVLSYYRQKFEYIMVDEYQDTNHAQFEWIRLLAEPRCNLCVVGDDDQSIYKFRGANIENILQFEKHFPNCRTVRLEQNYRSTQSILNAANAVIAHNIGRKGKTLWTENPAGALIEQHTALDEQDEAKYIADQVQDLVSKGRKYGDMAVLYRMNAQSTTIERAFVRSGIPYQIIGGHRFYERKEIRDMIAYLSVISNPDDTVRLRRIINEPKRAIGDKTVETAIEIGQQVGMSLFDVIHHADEFDGLRKSAAKLASFTTMMDDLIAEANDPAVPLADLYQHLLDRIDYITYLRGQNDEAESRIENINELSSNLIRYQEEAGETASLAGFLEEVALLTDIDNRNESADAVVMMTLHSAKGLEFPVVFMPGIEEGIFPGFQAITDHAEMEEERRLAYVGITRARELLYLVNASQRLIYGSTQRNKLSRFVEEIPDELLNRTQNRSWKRPDPGMKVPVAGTAVRASAIRSAHNIGTGSRPAVPPQHTIDFRAGDVVEHKTFGEGMVLNCTKMGSDALLEIAFDKVGTKKIFANFANLKKKMG